MSLSSFLAEKVGAKAGKVSVVMGCDHGGLELKMELKKLLESLGVSVEDAGCHSKDSVDYPDFAAALAEKVRVGGEDSGGNPQVFGVLTCGSGIGISIAANKCKGIRCALLHDSYGAEYSRLHNNANVAAFGGRTTGDEVAKKCLLTFLATEFEGGRHKGRVEKIMKLEN